MFLNLQKNLELHMVYTNWCGHSKKILMPDFDKVANEIDGSIMGEHSVSLVKHDVIQRKVKHLLKNMVLEDI